MTDSGEIQAPHPEPVAGVPTWLDCLHLQDRRCDVQGGPDIRVRRAPSEIVSDKARSRSHGMASAWSPWGPPRRRIGSRDRARADLAARAFRQPDCECSMGHTGDFAGSAAQDVT